MTHRFKVQLGKQFVVAVRRSLCRLHVEELAVSQWEIQPAALDEVRGVRSGL